MTSDLSRAIVISVGFECDSVHTVHIHHRDYPEVWASAGSPAEGAEYLIKLLSRSLDSISGGWRREAIERAIADVRDFLDQNALAAVRS